MKKALSLKTLIRILKVGQCVGILMIVCGGVINIYVRWTQIHLTAVEQLKKFWVVWLVTLLMIFGGVFMFAMSEWKKKRLEKEDEH